MHAALPLLAREACKQKSGEVNRGHEIGIRESAKRDYISLSNNNIYNGFFLP